MKFKKYLPHELVDYMSSEKSNIGVGSQNNSCEQK